MKVLPNQIRITVSEGIKTYEQTVARIEAGGSRIGTSASITIFVLTNRHI